MATAAGYPWVLGRVEQARARLLAASADHETAETHLHHAMQLHKVAGDLPSWCDALDQLAETCAARGHPEVAIRLAGAVHAQRTEHGYTASPGSELRSTNMADARRAAGTAADTLWEEGTKLDLGQATAYAGRQRGKRGRPSSGWQSLTPTELQIVRLVGQHLSNPQIADQLYVSRATVKTHLIHLFAKLNIASRSQLAAEAARQI